MKKVKKEQPRRRTGKKKPYRSPALVVHGDIRALTRSKGGTKSDGSGKPSTKATGSMA